jgi:hypothetical protein
VFHLQISTDVVVPGFTKFYPGADFSSLSRKKTSKQTNTHTQTSLYRMWKYVHVLDHCDTTAIWHAPLANQTKSRPGLCTCIYMNVIYLNHHGYFITTISAGFTAAIKYFVISYDLLSNLWFILLKWYISTDSLNSRLWRGRWQSVTIEVFHAASNYLRHSFGLVKINRRFY